MIEIKIVNRDKKQFLDLLLLGDEQEDMIGRYLEKGDLFALYDNDDLKSVAVVTQTDASTFELKNIATDEREQGKGYGSALIEHLFRHYADVCETLLVGTGDNPAILSFYESFGFELSHRIENFFVDHYDHPIFEQGKQLIDMVYLRRLFPKP